jgi:hypothetical protein
LENQEYNSLSKPRAEKALFFAKTVWLTSNHPSEIPDIMCRQITLFHARAAFFGSFYFLQPAIQKTGALLIQLGRAVY